MPSTLTHHSPRLSLRPRAAQASVNTTTAPNGQPATISYDLWMEFHATVVQALIPYKEPLEKVVQAVNQLQNRLGIVI